MTDDRAWVPTQFQQAEKVAHKTQPSPFKRIGKRRARKNNAAMVDRAIGTGASATAERKVIESFVVGKFYNLEVVNAIDGTTRKLKKARFKMLDDHGVLWFVDTEGRGRYIRPLAISKYKEVAG